MFTDEKRADMDLEGLWTARNTRRSKQSQRADSIFERSVVEDEARFESTVSEDNQSDEAVGSEEIEEIGNESTTLASDEADNVIEPRHRDDSKSQY